MDERVAAAMAQLESTKAAVAQAEAALKQASVSVHSQDRSVLVTVGARGDLQSVEFLDGRYRTMAAAQLSSAVIETVEKARQQMARQVMATFQPITDRASGEAEIAGFDVPWDEIFGPNITNEHTDSTSKLPSRLRDEIEDDEEELADSLRAEGSRQPQRRGTGHGR